MRLPRFKVKVASYSGIMLWYRITRAILIKRMGDPYIFLGHTTSAVVAGATLSIRVKAVASPTPVCPDPQQSTCTTLCCKCTGSCVISYELCPDSERKYVI